MCTRVLPLLRFLLAATNHCYDLHGPSEVHPDPQLPAAGLLRVCQGWVSYGGSSLGGFSRDVETRLGQLGLRRGACKPRPSFPPKSEVLKPHTGRRSKLQAGDPDLKFSSIIAGPTSCLRNLDIELTVGNVKHSGPNLDAFTPACLNAGWVVLQ